MLILAAMAMLLEIKLDVIDGGKGRLDELIEATASIPPVKWNPGWLSSQAVAATCRSSGSKQPYGAIALNAASPAGSVCQGE